MPRDDQGVAWIDETNVKVIEVVLDHLAYAAPPLARPIAAAKRAG